jgi:hypothetical protein
LRLFKHSFKLGHLIESFLAVASSGEGIERAFLDTIVDWVSF